MSYHELEEREERRIERGCLRAVAVALVLLSLLMAACLAGLGEPEAGSHGAPSVEDVANADEPALVGLATGTYAYPAWDRENRVCYLVVTRGAEVCVLPRLNPDGSLMVLGDR